jgi:glycosyltransferase involved in cell wall biosynthesis
MKVLVNAISAKQGGIVTYTQNLMRSFRDLGIDATFAVSPGFPDKKTLPVLVVDVGGFGLGRRALWEQTIWRRIVARHNPDVLFSSANYALLKCPVPQLLLVREGGLFDEFYLVNVAPTQGIAAAAIRAIRRQSILRSTRAADHVFTPTGAMRDLLCDWAPDLTGKISFNHYGTLDDHFKPAARARSWRDDGQLRLLYVSVYYPHKSPGDVAEATRLLRQQGIPSRAWITMTLDEIRAVRGSAWNELRLAQAVKEDLIDLGRCAYDRLPDLYAGHDVFVFPSIAETFGHPMVEAMSSGTPVVAADAPVNREVCGDAALYFKPFSPSSLAEQIRALDASPELRATLIARARDRVIDHFRWSDHVRRLIDDLKRVAARQPVP